VYVGGEKEVGGGRGRREERDGNGEEREGQEAVLTEVNVSRDHTNMITGDTKGQR